MKSIVSAKKKKERQYHGPIWGNANASYAKREYAPGQHGQRKKKMTDYGEQLNAKQRLKTYYGNVSENSSTNIMLKQSEEPAMPLKTSSVCWSLVWTTWYTKQSSFRPSLLPASS